MNIKVKYLYKKIKEKLTARLAWLLPHYLVMWCYIRVVAHATTGNFDKTILPELSVMDALKRWDTNNGPTLMKKIIKFGRWNSHSSNKYIDERIWQKKKNIFNYIPFVYIPYGWTPFCTRKQRY